MDHADHDFNLVKLKGEEETKTYQSVAMTKEKRMKLDPSLLMTLSKNAVIQNMHKQPTISEEN